MDEYELPPWVETLAKTVGFAVGFIFGATIVVGIIASAAYLVHVLDDKWAAAMLGFVTYWLLNKLQKALP